MKCETCRYFANEKCVMNFKEEECDRHKDHIELPIEPHEEQKEVIDAINNPNYKPTPQLEIDVYNRVGTIDDHLNDFKKTGKINGKDIPIDYFDSYESMLYIKVLMVHGIQEFRKINRTKAFLIILDGKDSLIDENYKKLINLLTCK